MLRRLASAALLLACATSCARLPDPRLVPPDTPGFHLAAGEVEVDAEASGSSREGSLEGERVDLEWTDSRVTGTALGHRVDLSVAETAFEGILGDVPANFSVSRWPNAVTAHGNLGGVPTTLRLSSRTIVGSIGRCSFDLAEFDGTYQGWRRCPAGDEAVWVRFPEPITKMRPAKLAATVVALLGHPSASAGEG